MKETPAGNTPETGAACCVSMYAGLMQPSGSGLGFRSIAGARSWPSFPGLESFARDLEAEGRARATVTRRLCTIAGFYKYAVEEELLDHSPAAYVRRPRMDYESHAVAMDRNELGALLVAAGLGPPLEHALISLLALNGLRVSEATGADVEQLGLERGHRTLTITLIRAARSSPSRRRPAPPVRSTWPSGNAQTGRSSWLQTDGGWTVTAPGGSSARSRAAPESPRP